ncbi:MAG: DUF4349 domain-containing protein [Oscillatoria sp. SIO1A7]|nr:DUF4349 domain-containing protein [Oscillatoria sp. SIO1A7]
MRKINSTFKTQSSKIQMPLLLLISVLTSCAGMPDRAVLKEAGKSTAVNAPAVTEVQNAQIASGGEGYLAVADSGNLAVPDESRPQTQLIKEAELSVLVESIADAIQTVSNLVKQQQGDLLEFQDNKPVDTRSRHTAHMQIRVPQQRLEATINALAELGKVRNRSLTARDVSDQLVDLDARLRNLRKQEELVLKIMERSGKVGEVLEAARELSNTREAIERIDAQLKNLQNQVAYSKISLYLEAPALETGQPSLSLGLQLSETWGNAVSSVRGFSLGLVKLFLYLLVFSPYLLLLSGGVWTLRKATKKKGKTEN